MPLTIHIHPADNVVVALRPLARGTAVELPDCGQTVTAAEDIPQGHKMAVSPIRAGENVVKYGFPIGHATADIAPGGWVHTHNLKTNLSGEVEYAYTPDLHPLAPVTPESFMGFRRADGRAAILAFSQADYGARRVYRLKNAPGELFAALRQLDEDGMETIYAEDVPTAGVGLAVMNRLMRAAAFRVVETQ